MYSNFKKTLGLLCFIFISISGFGQSKFEDAKDVKGTVTKKENVLSYVKSLKALSPTKANSLAATTEKIQALICSIPVLNPPMGFDVRMNLSTTDYSLKEKEPQGMIFCFLRNLLRDKNTGTIKKSMDGADIYLYLNDFNIFRQMGNYWKDCSDLHFPLFFEQPAFSDSTDDYFTFSYKGDPVRIVAGNDRPLLIPLTRVEFLKFLVIRMEKVLKHEKESLQSTRDSKTSLENMLTTAKESDKADVRSSIKTVEYDISMVNKNLLNEQNEINNCNAALKSLSPEDAKSAVRINYDAKTDATRFGGLSQVVAPGRKEGVALVKINPNYYNYTASASAVQFIVMYYAWPKVGFEQDPNYVEQAALDIFNHLDYHALKLSMK